MAGLADIFGNFNLTTDPGTSPGIDFGNFNLGNFEAPDWQSPTWDTSQFNLGQGFDVGQYGGPSASTFNLGDYGPDSKGGGGFDLNSILGTAGKIGQLGQFGLSGILGAIRTKQMGDYNKQVQDYYKAQSDYVKQKQAYEADFMNQFKSAQEEFAGETGAFEEQIAGAQAQAQGVLDQFQSTAGTLLGQSQDLLVPAIAALAKGEVPESLKPLLDQARQRATATAMQSMVSAGMSPEQARASATPMVDQQLSAMLSQLASSMSTQGLAIGAQGMQGLQGAGQMADVLGKLAAAGYAPLAQEFGNMLQVYGHLLGSGTTLPPPPVPQA
jgi:hypothetical protein